MMDDSTKALLGVVGAVGIVIAAELYLKYKKQQVQAQAATQTQQQQQVQQQAQQQSSQQTQPQVIVVKEPYPTIAYNLPPSVGTQTNLPPYAYSSLGGATRPKPIVIL